MLVYGKYECFRHTYIVCFVCIMWAVFNAHILHDLQFVNAGPGCKRRPYGRGILQSRSHGYL